MRVAVLRGRLRGLASGTSLLAATALLAVGLVETHRGVLSIDAVIAASMITRLLSRPVRTLGLMHDYWHRGMVSKGKVADFLRSSSRPLEADLAAPIKVRKGAVRFEEVEVAGRLAPFSAEIRPGTIVGLTGPPGSGPTAILDLLARQVDPSAGCIYVDGQDLAQTRPSSMSRHVGYASANLPLMRGSIRRNLMYGDREATPEDVQRIYLSLGLDRVCDRAGRDGILHWLTERGGNLDPGDRQLLALGRALVGNPTFLLLDDPLAGISEDHRAEVREALLRHNGTVFWATPCPEELELVDEVWSFDESGLVERMSARAYREQQWTRGTGGGAWRLRSST